MRTEYWHTSATALYLTLVLAPISLPAQFDRLNVNLVGSARLGEIGPSSYVSDIQVAGQYAFVTGWQMRAQGLGSLEVFDVSDPRTPTWVGRYETDHALWSFRLRGDLAFLTGIAASGSNYVGALEI